MALSHRTPQMLVVSSIVTAWKDPILRCRIEIDITNPDVDQFSKDNIVELIHKQFRNFKDKQFLALNCRKM